MLAAVALDDHWVWLAGAVAFLVVWLALFAALPRHRARMLVVGALTAPLGLSEPLFVPAYWNPPTLFDLAQRTGFDVESVLFSFALGGVASVLYPALTRGMPVPLAASQIHARGHRFHLLALLAPALVFAPLYLFVAWNPIYPAIVAIGAGALATMACRPDLARRTLTGGVLFLGLYVGLLMALRLAAPGYIERVWNLPALLPVRPLGMPIEELLFATACGMYWAGAYEHFAWTTTRSAAPAAATGAWSVHRGHGA